MRTPIDVITKAIQDNLNLGTRDLAVAVAAKLDHNEIVANAVQALKAWQRAAYDADNPYALSVVIRDGYLTDEDWTAIARVVLRSVGEA